MPTPIIIKEKHFLLFLMGCLLKVK
ncbi:hypothetical protein KL86CLO1_11404 [uncultured Eubacteriales bacterium]|uniref:Uncharacterized protein n=1 Tax=uncultured Eubacteriales bacterium TaxID=172733 RepID=A0A212JN73_9FIRM|nr:hypothetical protein KL86CLO1_11404 [uncultured Eubacteriales bacterium]